VTQGRLNVVSMPVGVMTTFEFVADPRTPMTLDGLTCETLLLAESSKAAETIHRIPMTITGNQIRLCAHPVHDALIRLKSSGVAITPELNGLTIPQTAETKLRFLVRKTVNVSGRVVHRDGTPHKGTRVVGQIENLTPEGTTPSLKEWTSFGAAVTDPDGKYTIALAPGRGRIEVNADGFAIDRDYAELDVRVEGLNEIPNFTTDEIQPIGGQVVDESDRPVPGVIVRVRNPSVRRQPDVTDAEGKFEIRLDWIPLNFDTNQRQYELDVAAFVADQPLMGVTRIDLRRRSSMKEMKIVLRPQSSIDALLSMEDNKWGRARKQTAAPEQKAEEGHAVGERGQPAPEFDGAAWFNTDARSLKDFRGRYVLLDFWFVGCGPCHEDFPSVKLVHERFEKHGVTVIGVHNNSSTPDAVSEHCQKLGLKFPIVVDHPDGRILNAYRKLGIHAFPSYLLIGPDGKILENDEAASGPSLHSFKLEVIRKYILDRGNSAP
jgi:peroxiredoxin